MGVVRDLVCAHEMKRSDREPAHEVALEALARKEAWSEVKVWRHDLEARLGLPGAIDRIPGLSNERKAEIRATVSMVDVAVREAHLTTGRELDRVRSQDMSMSRGRDTGYGY